MKVKIILATFKMNKLIKITSKVVLGGINLTVILAKLNQNIINNKKKPNNLK